MPRRVWFRFRPRPRPRRWHWTPDPRWVSLILAGVLLAAFFTMVNARIRPILTAMAVTQISNAVTSAVNDAITEGITEEHISYDDMVTVETDANGRATVLTSNLEQANLLRAELLSRVLDAVSALSVEDFSIPIGNLTDIDFFSGRGPEIHIQVLSTGAASASFSHSFTDAGVNQTLHQILLDVSVTVQILLPGQTLELPVSTQLCVAETVIVGEVPQTYLQLEQ
mgnify:CR=1 FL=1